MNAQMDKVKPGEIDAIVDKYPADQQERVRVVLAKSSGFGNMESLNELRSAMQPHLKGGAALYTPGRGSLADNVAYLGDKGGFDAKVAGSAGKPPVTNKVNGKVIVILDAVVLGQIKDPVFAKSLVDNKAILLEPVGFNDGNNMYNAPTPEVIAQRTKSILDRANAIKSTDPKMSFDVAVTQALRENTQKALDSTAVGAQLKAQLQPVDPAAHADVKSSAAIADQLNGKAGITAEGVHNAVSGMSDADAALFRELMAHQAEIFSSRRQSQAVGKQAQNMYDIAAQKGVPKDKVYYFIFKDMKSYGMVAMAHREMTGTAPDHYINGAAELSTRNLPPDAMLVVLDDVAGSGDSLRQATAGAKSSGFQGQIVVSPMVSTVEAQALFNGAPGTPNAGIARPGSNVTYAPESMVNSLKDSQWFNSLPRPKQDRLVDILKHTGFPGAGQPDLAGNGLSMAFPYMAPDNNNAFFADQVAPAFIANNNENASKNNYGEWTPPSP